MLVLCDGKLASVSGQVGPMGTRCIGSEKPDGGMTGWRRCTEAASWYTKNCLLPDACHNRKYVARVVSEPI